MERGSTSGERGRTGCWCTGGGTPVCGKASRHSSAPTSTPTPVASPAQVPRSASGATSSATHLVTAAHRSGVVRFGVFHGLISLNVSLTSHFEA